MALFFRLLPERVSRFLKKLTDVKFDAVVGHWSKQWTASYLSFPHGTSENRTWTMCSTAVLIQSRSKTSTSSRPPPPFTPAAGTHLHNMECCQSRDAALQGRRAVFAVHCVIASSFPASRMHWGRQEMQQSPFGDNRGIAWVYELI